MKRWGAATGFLWATALAAVAAAPASAIPGDVFVLKTAMPSGFPSLLRIEDGEGATDTIAAGGKLRDVTETFDTGPRGTTYFVMQPIGPPRLLKVSRVGKQEVVRLHPPQGEPFSPEDVTVTPDGAVYLVSLRHGGGPLGSNRYDLWRASTATGKVRRISAPGAFRGGMSIDSTARGGLVILDNPYIRGENSVPSGRLWSLPRGARGPRVVTSRGKLYNSGGVAATAKAAFVIVRGPGTRYGLVKVNLRTGAQTRVFSQEADTSESRHSLEYVAAGPGGVYMLETDARSGPVGDGRGFYVDFYTQYIDRLGHGTVTQWPEEPGFLIGGLAVEPFLP